MGKLYYLLPVAILEKVTRARKNQSYVLYGIIVGKGSGRLKGQNNLFNNGDVVNIQKTGELVTILKWQYIKHLRKYSYIVQEHPSTFYFEEEFQKE
ncbi:hypothetical protein [Alkalihalobacillus sp. AL-G]|uniref:hypothetical protein n=1 Tax=Alkalihalobacillus sp. AL-G TaxID=2926399 RepID=UPI00272C148B|nr:hypothetical protein [Alkalihalobacillus sp. AL-G]WLD95495.1 hypothetical protein MOJ78_04565 [Alkalihalobacillus sp. AL-G]